MQVIRNNAVTIRIPVPHACRNTAPLTALVKSAGGCTKIEGHGAWVHPTDACMVEEYVTVWHMSFSAGNSEVVRAEIRRKLNDVMQRMLDGNKFEKEFLVLMDAPGVSETITYRRD